MDKTMRTIETCRMFYDTATKEVGINEAPGEENNPRVLEYHAVTKGGATLDSIPWCAAFVSWVIEQCGISSTKSAWARHYLSWGLPIEEPITGCIAVFERNENSGHVGFYSHDDKENVYVLGGNQKDQVCVMPYPKSRLLGYRIPNIKLRLYADLVKCNEAIGTYKMVWRESLKECKNHVSREDIEI